MIATDGREPSPAAMRAATRLALQLGVRLAPVNVLHPDPTRHPASLIDGVAREQDASMIVMDRAPHDLLHRIAGDEIDVDVIRHSRTPVYAVDPEEPASLRRIVVGVDFSPASLRAARLALAMIDRAPRRDVAVVSLVHVRPRFEESAGDAVAWAEDYAVRVAGLLDALCAMLRADVPAGVLLETRSVRGLPVACLLDTAIELEADLIAVGTRSAGWLDRLLTGSVAASMLRRSRQSVLVVPPPATGEGPGDLRIRSTN